jgi:hypothetical protein
MLSVVSCVLGVVGLVVSWLLVVGCWLLVARRRCGCAVRCALCCAGPVAGCWLLAVGQVGLGPGAGAEPRFCIACCSKGHTAGPGAPWGPTGRFQCPQVCIKYAKGLSQKKHGSADSPPPRWPPVLGFLVRSAEGRLPSTHNWPFRWSLPPTSPPQVIPMAM